jgi:hypothetical protein
VYLYTKIVSKGYGDIIFSGISVDQINSTGLLSREKILILGDLNAGIRTDIIPEIKQKYNDRTTELYVHVYKVNNNGKGKIVPVLN